MFTVGQGVLGKVRFIDGEMPSYDRTYLVVKTEVTEIKVLNISSIYGKEEKLLMPSNEKIVNYKPPFLKPSFVKLDSLTSVKSSDWHGLRLLHNGETLNPTELNKILKCI